MTFKIRASCKINSAQIKLKQNNNKTRKTMSIVQETMVTRWSLKPVTIKTMEGVFTVKMWDQRNVAKSMNSETTTEETIDIKNEIEEPIQIEVITTEDSPQPPQNLKLVECIHGKCNKVFRDHSTMRKHLLIHGPRTYICYECGKSFLENSKLKRHQLVHNGERPFQCPACFKRFSLNYNLKTHYRIHTGDRPYVCTWGGCGKQFAQLPNLKSHQLVHDKKSKVK